MKQDVPGSGKKRIYRKPHNGWRKRRKKWGKKERNLVSTAPNVRRPQANKQKETGRTTRGGIRSFANGKRRAKKKKGH